MDKASRPADDDDYDSSQERDMVKNAVKVIKTHLKSISLKDMYDLQKEKNEKKEMRKAKKAKKVNEGNDISVLPTTKRLPEA